MDRKPSQAEQIQQLIRSGDVARSFLGEEARDLKQRLDVPSRVKSSLKTHPTGWLLGSLGAGLAASLLFRRKPRIAREEKRKSFPLAMLGLTLTAIRPFARVWLTDQVKNYLAGPSFAQGESRPRHF